MLGAAEHLIDGEHLTLLPERAVLWQERSTLLVADVHFGKAAAFRSAAVPVPRGTTAMALARMELMLGAVRPKRLIFLGDLWHAKSGRTEQVVSEVAAWRRRHEDVDMILVEGNHDRRSGKLPDELGIEEHLDPLIEGPFAFRHEPYPHPDGYAIGGHIHPCVQLVGRANQSARLPCFLFSERVAILPAFGEFTGCAGVEPGPGDSVFVIAEGHVISVGAGRAANRR
jgi:uncharacterized protein